MAKPLEVITTTQDYEEFQTRYGTFGIRHDQEIQVFADDVQIVNRASLRAEKEVKPPALEKLTKEQLVDYARKHKIRVATSWSKSKMVTVIRGELAD